MMPCPDADMDLGNECMGHMLPEIQDMGNIVHQCKLVQAWMCIDQQFQLVYKDPQSLVTLDTCLSVHQAAEGSYYCATNLPVQIVFEQ